MWTFVYWHLIDFLICYVYVYLLQTWINAQFSKHPYCFSFIITCIQNSDMHKNTTKKKQNKKQIANLQGGATLKT